MNVKAKNYFPAIAIVAVLGAALFLAAPLSASSVFAQEANNVKPRPNIQQQQVEQVQQSDESVFFTLEQSVGSVVSAECLVELDNVGVTVFESSVIVKTPEVQQAVEVAAEELATAAPENTAVTTAIEEIVVEIEANNTEVAAAVEANVDEVTVTTEAAENAIITEVIELTVGEETVNEIVLGGVEAVLTGNATAEEAATQVETNLNQTFESVEVTPEIVEQAVEVVQSENGIVEQLGGEEAAAPTVIEPQVLPMPEEPAKEGEAVVAEPTKEGEAVVAEPAKEDGETTTTTTAPEVEAVVEETIVENAEEIGQQAGVDANTVRDLLAQAQAAIAAAQAQLGF